MNCLHAGAQAQRANMFACGPYCSTCNAILRVERCLHCSQLQAFSAFNLFCNTIERFSVAGLSHYECGTHLRIIPMACILSPGYVMQLASVCTREYPTGILVFHCTQKACCRFRCDEEVTMVPLTDALRHLMAAPAIAFVILAKGRMVTVSLTRA